MTKALRIWLVAVIVFSSAEAQVYLGNYTGHAIAGKAITVNAGSAAVRFTFYRPDVLRVDFLPDPTAVPDSSLVVVQDTTEIADYSVTERETALEISSTAITVACFKNPLRISYRNSAGRLLLQEPASGGLAADGEKRIATFSLDPRDHFYGTGERGTSLDKRGQAFDSYNTQTFGYTSPLPTMNANVPFLASTNGYALYFENTFPGRFDLGAADNSKFSYRASGGELSYYLIAGSSVPDQLRAYTWLTGRQPLPPRWAFGYIQSKFGYRDENEARAMVQTMRQKEIPCDAIVIDIYWFDHMGDLSWNLSAWPNPFQMIQDFLGLGVKTIVITEPYLVQYSVNFTPASAFGFLANDDQGQPYLIHNWWACNCDAGLLDLTDPAVQNWWWSKHPSFFGNQLAGIWTDLGEPENHPSGMQHLLGSAAKVHNVYNLLWAKTIFEGFASFRPNQRLFNLTRSGYAGIQRYGAILWSGDVGTTFGGLAVQLPMLLNMGISGLAYHNSDIGGFCC
ncbi:MAG TPA: TIM-barrel domain-containing protein, partial [Bacteroidota bacterium]